MEGDDKVRHCDQCDQRVYNLSNMSRVEAEELIQKREGKMCVQFYRRPDGTVVTRDCVMIRWSKSIVSTVVVACFAALSFFFLGRLLHPTPAKETFSFVGGGMCP
jgi:hypothetical protein